MYLNKYYGQKTTVKKKKNCFMKNCVASLLTFFEKVRTICEFIF